MNRYEKPKVLFILTARISIGLLFLLILAGGTVRSSGSGMGCPDWPKCFNRLIPPTQASELPVHYREEYKSRRKIKNAKLASFLAKLGLQETAKKIRNDPKILEVDKFNAFNTWAEYINRLIGILTGFSFLALFLLSIFLWIPSPGIFWVSFINLFLILIQAYLGSLVVSTHLLPGITTVHMVLAILILFLLILSLNWALKDQAEQETLDFMVLRKPISQLWILVLMISLLQIILGTSVRESFDGSEWGHLTDTHFMLSAGTTFPWHRMVSILVFIFNFGLGGFILLKVSISTSLRNQIRSNFVIIVMQMVIGISLEFGHLPPISQALHVFLAVILFASQVWTLFLWQNQVSGIARL